NTAASSVVYTATATDPDTVGSISFSLSGADAALFSIDATTGEDRILAPLDSRPRPDSNGDNAYQDIVHANDGVHDTTQALTISVTDTNRAAATTTSPYTTLFRSNTAASSVVYTATATDPDTVGSISFSLSGADAALFSIDATTG